MEDIRNNNIENAILNAGELEKVSGGKANHKAAKNLDLTPITVACQKCEKPLTIYSHTTAIKCSCGHVNYFYG